MPEEKLVFFSIIDSPLGRLLLAASEDGLRRVEFHRGELPRPGRNEVWIESRERLNDCEQQLNAYFRGRLREFTCELDLAGTEFQKACWRALLRIPYGQTRTYAEIAREIGRPLACRAVGQANHDNPIAIIVPCHRVVGANGALTGYGGGLGIKEKLLQLEGAGFSPPRRVEKNLQRKKRAADPAQQARFEY